MDPYEQNINDILIKIFLQQNAFKYRLQNGGIFVSVWIC